MTDKIPSRKARRIDKNHDKAEALSEAAKASHDPPDLTRESNPQPPASEPQPTEAEQRTREAEVRDGFLNPHRLRKDDVKP